MSDGFYRRSPLWRLLFFGLPIAAFVFMLIEVSGWDLPRGGPVASNEREFTRGYQTTTLVLAAIAVIPYLWLLLRFGDRLRLTEEFIQQRRFLTNRTLRWEDVIEYESFPNYIHLSPTDESLGIYIDYFMTFNRHQQLTRLIRQKCTEYAANMSGRRRMGRLVVCDFGLAPTILFVVSSALLLSFLRQRIVLLGVLSGVVLTLLSAWVWITTRRAPDRGKPGMFIYLTIFMLLLILPPAYFAQGITNTGLKTVGVFGLLYVVGLMGGSGILASLLPNRKRR